MAGFFSSDLVSSDLTSGLPSEVSAGEMVNGGISGAGVAGRESTEERVSSIVRLIYWRMNNFVDRLG